MGRLTLNVLLSFAQFEREVTGERIRDKIAASKAKGMWMGGVPPLGYDVPEPGSRTLRVNNAEAITVGHIFNRYLELGSVHALQRDLQAEVIVSKRHTTLAGRTTGGAAFKRTAANGTIRRVSALRIERHLEACSRRWLRDPAAGLDAIRAVQVYPGHLDVTVPRPKGLQLQLGSDDRLLAQDSSTARIAVPICLGSDRRVLASRGAAPSDGPDTTLVAALRRAHRMLARDSGGPMLEAAPLSIYERKILRLALLAPDIQRDIITGRQPRGFNLEAFVNGDVPLAWPAQRQALGWT